MECFGPKSSWKPGKPFWNWILESRCLFTVVQTILNQGTTSWKFFSFSWSLFNKKFTCMQFICIVMKTGPKQKFRPNLFRKRDDLVWIILEDLLLILQLGFLELNHHKKTLNFFLFIYFFFFAILRTLTHVLLYKNTHISHQLSYHGGLFIFHLCWFFFFFFDL